MEFNWSYLVFAAAVAFMMGLLAVLIVWAFRTRLYAPVPCPVPVEQIELAQRLRYHVVDTQGDLRGGFTFLQDAVRFQSSQPHLTIVDTWDD